MLFEIEDGRLVIGEDSSGFALRMTLLRRNMFVIPSIARDLSQIFCLDFTLFQVYNGFRH